MFCPNCGFPYGPDDRFCGRCGAALPGREDSAPAPPPQQPFPPPARPKRRLPRFVIPAVLVLAAAAGVLAFFLTRSSQPDPSFVPDSQTSFFFLARDNPTQAELWRGTEQVLTLPAEDVVFRSAAGSMDKSVLLLVDAGGTLYRADSVGCTTLSEQVLYCALSGDGSTSAWVTAAGQLWLQRNEEAPVLVADGVSPYSVLLSYGGHTLAWQTASDSDGSSHLCLMLDSGALQELPPEDAAAALVTDSGTLYYTVLDGDMLSLYVWRDGTSTLLTDRLLPFGTTLACNRDGTELLYMTEEDDGPVTWFCQEGEEPRSIGSFAFQSLCSPAFSSSSYIDTDHLSVWLYNTDTLRQKCLRTDQNVWLLDSNGDASPLFPDGSTITSAYVSQDGTSLVVQTTGVSEKNTLYRFDNLWGDLESQELDHGHELSLLGASPDLSLLLYTCLDTDLVRTYYALKAGGEPVLLTQGNEFAVLTADNTVLCSTGDSTGLLFSDGGEPIPLEVPGTEDGDAFITVAGVGNLTCVTAYTIADLATSALSPVDVYTVSPDGALTLLTEDILYLYAY
ncbi:zinc ribbon domain-containing protein [Pseudoflavonifractor capillosus]|uniref:zinc ribbon domain-containing protein n=1 Tax=Pseudoflavonifractor capillosus TaxID=106588 RepID=UPI000308296C|nr:zinc ribbon domain-containing protein [Pseudoflavonifractor capillosus]